MEVFHCLIKALTICNPLLGSVKVTNYSAKSGICCLLHENAVLVMWAGLGNFRLGTCSYYWTKFHGPWVQFSSRFGL
jgi:hypothetical protein